jgi:predicted phosphodiesterase
VRLHKHNVLVIADTHEPFSKAGYLDFCLDIQKRCKCGTVVHIGDLVDNASLSFHHDIDPNGKSPKDEIDSARKSLREWYKAFPKVFLCLGNHDRRVDLKGKHVGLPECVFRPFRDIWELPKTWKDAFNHEIDNVIYQHGTGYSGDSAHLKAAYNNRQSTVIGHTHSQAGIGFLANEKDCIWGMNVGSGIDRHKIAFSYGRDYPKKPIVACGIVSDRGKYAQIFPMQL